jgi:hypothetical protein
VLLDFQITVLPNRCFYLLIIILSELATKSENRVRMEVSIALPDRLQDVSISDLAFYQSAIGIVH